MKRILLCAVLLGLAAPASAGLCTLLVANQSCSYASDTSGGTATFSNPVNYTNVGAGVISPFLTSQNAGNTNVEFAVSTDIGAVNQLPLDDKRDNTKFTQTFLLSQMLAVNGVYILSLDSDEPNNDTRTLLINSLRIWGQTGPNASDPFLASNVNVPDGGILDTLNSVFPNLSLVYTMGLGNSLLMDSTLNPGSGIGYDMIFTIPVSQFAGLLPDSRIVLSVDYRNAEDGPEEWSVVTGTPLQVPEPNSLALAGLGLLGLGFTVRRSRA